jgi:hypothetical protein
MVSMETSWPSWKGTFLRHGFGPNNVRRIAARHGDAIYPQGVVAQSVISLAAKRIYVGYLPSTESPTAGKRNTSTPIRKARKIFLPCPWEFQNGIGRGGTCHPQRHKNFHIRNWPK